MSAKLNFERLNTVILEPKWLRKDEIMIYRMGRSLTVMDTYAHSITTHIRIKQSNYKHIET